MQRQIRGASVPAAAHPSGEVTKASLNQNDPAAMPKDISFEALLYVASAAYQRKMGNRMQHLPAYNFETYSNEAGWK